MKTLYWMCFCVCLLLWNVAEAGTQEIENAATHRIDELIQQLSDRKFSIRQQAMGQLVALGGEAIPALKFAISDGNRETRFRALRVLDAVEENVFQQKLEEFLQAGVGDDKVSLPGWRRFCEQIDETSESRRLFVTMSRSAPRVMRSVDRGIGETGAAVDRRCIEVQLEMSKGRRDVIPLGTVAALLFAAGIEDVKLARNSIKTVFSVCNYEAFRAEMYTVISTNRIRYKSTPRSNMLRELFAGCLGQCESWDAQMALSLAMRYNIRQCVKRSLYLINDKKTPCHVVQIAMIAVGKFGELEHIPVLEQRIDDTGFCGTIQRIENVQYRTQLRDVAIAVMLTIAGENPKEYGFVRMQYSTTRQVNYSTIGFAEESKRMETRAKWDAFRSDLELPVAETADGEEK